jgi:hypothetical protein
MGILDLGRVMRDCVLAGCAKIRPGGQWHETGGCADAAAPLVSAAMIERLPLSRHITRRPRLFVAAAALIVAAGVVWVAWLSEPAPGHASAWNSPPAC